MRRSVSGKRFCQLLGQHFPGWSYIGPCQCLVPASTDLHCKILILHQSLLWAVSSQVDISPEHSFHSDPTGENTSMHAIAALRRRWQYLCWDCWGFFDCWWPNNPEIIQISTAYESTFLGQTCQWKVILLAMRSQWWKPLEPSMLWSFGEYCIHQCVQVTWKFAPLLLMEQWPCELGWWLAVRWEGEYPPTMPRQQAGTKGEEGICRVKRLSRETMKLAEAAGVPCRHHVSCRHIKLWSLGLIGAFSWWARRGWELTLFHPVSRFHLL